MKLKLCLIVFINIQFCLAQNIEVKLLDSIPIKADRFVGTDEFGNYYYTIANTLYKKEGSKTYSYTNTQLGTITSVNLTNPLKIVVFYKGFNSIILLDNRLNDLNDLINLTTENFTKNVSYCGISSNNNLWLFSNDDNSLTLWNYETDKIVFESQPLSFYIKDLKVTGFKSDYKFCWIVTENEVLKFNEFGSFLESVELEKEENVYPFADSYFSIEKNVLYYLKPDKSKIEILQPKHKMKNLVVENTILYFFDANWLYRYTVLKN